MKKNAYTIAALTIIPWLYLIFYLIQISIEGGNSFHDGSNSLLSDIHSFMNWYGFGLFAFYCYLVFKEDRLDAGGKLLWILGFVFFSILTMTIYWRRYIFISQSKEKVLQTS